MRGPSVRRWRRFAAAAPPVAASAALPLHFSCTPTPARPGAARLTWRDTAIAVLHSFRCSVRANTAGQATRHVSNVSQQGCRHREVVAWTGHARRHRRRTAPRTSPPPVARRASQSWRRRPRPARATGTNSPAPTRQALPRTARRAPRRARRTPRAARRTRRRRRSSYVGWRRLC